MDIEQAKALKPGDEVIYPVDRGDPSGIGAVTGVGEEESSNINGERYLWIEVDVGHKKSVWPSNRLTLHKKPEPANKKRSGI